MTVQEAKVLLKKVQDKEPLTKEEQSKIQEAFKVISSNLFNIPTEE